MVLGSIILGACLALGAGRLILQQQEACAAGAERSASEGNVFLTKEEALKLAFPGCDVERMTVYLSEAERLEAMRLAGFDVKTNIAYLYVASKDKQPMGSAWFDVSLVRSKKQLVMFVISPGRRIQRFELLAFAEPSDYIPRPSWYAQLLGKGLDDNLSLKRGIKSVTGATLTARATVNAARRVLALEQVLLPRPKPEDEQR